MLSRDRPKEHVLAYRLIFYCLFAGLVPEHHLIKKLLPILMNKQFSLDWVLDVDSSVLDSKFGYAGQTFAKMLKDLAEKLEEKFDGEIPTSYDNLLLLPGIDDRAAILYMNYSAERSEVSLLVACVKFPSGSEY